MIINKRYYRLNLQLFATAEDEGRTEAPTPKRLREEREKGRVAKTVELGQVVILLAGFIFLALFAKSLFESILRFTSEVLASSATFNFSMGNYKTILMKMVMQLLRMIAPIFAITFIAAFLADFVQVGFQVSTYPLKPEISKISFNFQKMINRIFYSRQVAANLLKSIFKIIAIGFVTFLIIKVEFKPMFRTIGMNLSDSIGVLSWATFKVVIWVGIFLLILSLFDYLYQRHEFLESMKMTIHELKEERRQTEGDPLVKMRQRERMREFAMRRMMSEVPKADVVITNPEHFAVAIMYDSSYMHAPIVVAKGMGFIAERIKQIAKEYDVYIMENKPLAQALYRQVEIGEEIPEDLFQAVAEVLAFVYRLKKVAV